LASMYYDGQGVPKDLIKAYIWYELASSSNQTANGNRLFLRGKLTQDELVQARQLARECLTRNYKDC
jgi:TPR repeat protein